ncbi:hypothetical protein ACVXG9_21685 [Escherichia coli]
MTPISRFITTTSTHTALYSAQPAHAFTGKYAVLLSPGSGKFFRNVQLDPAANLGVVKVTATAWSTIFSGG